MLSIIIPTYNRFKLLRRCLKGVLSEPQDFEVVVINDCSTDDTDELMQGINDTRVVYLRQEKNKGVNAARNRAFKEAKGEWLLCLDDDDEMMRGSISQILERLSEMPQDFNIAYFNTKIIRDDAEIVGGFQFEEGEIFHDPTYQETMTKFNLKGDCKPAFRKSLFENKKYLFPESVNGFESYTMNLLARDKKGIRYWKDIVMLVHQESVISDRLSITAPIKRPWQMFVLHFKQIFSHFNFYTSHPSFLYKKIKETAKLFIRAVFQSNNYFSKIKL